MQAFLLRFSFISIVLMQDLVEPLLYALCGDAEVGRAAGNGPALAPVAALFVLSRLCHSLTYRPLLKKLIVALMGVSEGAGTRSCILDAVRACFPRDLAASALCLLSVLASNRFADDAALGTLLLLVGCDLTDAPRTVHRRRGFAAAPSAQEHAAAACAHRRAGCEFSGSAGQPGGLGRELCR